jgi:uncharacterized tellurite resistance protein B-like protein
VVTADVVKTAIKNVKNQKILVEVTTCNPIDLQDICRAAKHFSEQTTDFSGHIKKIRM